MTASGVDPLTSPEALPAAGAPQQSAVQAALTASQKSPSLGKNSLARLVSDLLAIVLALVAATITARLLGPAAKGYYSSLVLLGGLFMQVFSAGLGEAAIVLAARGRTSLQLAVSATTFVMLPLGLVGGVAFFLTASVVLPETAGAGGSMFWASMLVGVNAVLTTSVCFLLAKERVVAASALSVLATALTTALLWVLIAVFDLGTGGALLAGVLGSGVAVVSTLLLVVRSGLSVRPRWAADYIASAARFGAALQFSNLLVALTARVDLVLVYRLSSPSDAGNYSIALSIGALVGAVPIALSYAAFPRLAVLGDPEARTLTGQVFRIGVSAAMVAAAVLAAAAPLVIPLVFGRAYEGAVVPTLVLIPGGVLWSAQWLLCRAAAARGAPKALVTSFALSFLAMIALDFVLIAPFGATGASLASLAAAGTGLCVAWVFSVRNGLTWHEVRPRGSDVAGLFATVRGMMTSAPRDAGRAGRR